MTAARIAGKGIYDIPMEQYHGDCCEGPSVSGSGLVTIEQRSLAHYHWASYHNPNREELDTTALAFGRACHAWTLGEPEWNKYFILSPYEEFRTKEAKAWREAQSRTIVKAEQFEAIKVMTEQLRRHPLLKNALTRQAVRPVSACEAQSIADLKAPFKGTIYETTFDGRTE